MEKIILKDIYVKSERVVFDFEISEGLRKYFSGEKFVIEYSESVESVPKAILAVPFVGSVLPIVWLSDAMLYIEELDGEFYCSIPDIKQGYVEMYPESKFAGKIIVSKVVECERSAILGKSAMLYSGGVDSTYTLCNHLKEKPELITVWGSDVRYFNEEDWNLVFRQLQDTAKSFNLSLLCIRSSFRDFDDEDALQEQFSKQLKSGWWYGIKHGLALLTHVAPLAYLHQYQKLYIASSNWPEIMPDRCASDPSIDNNVSYANCAVFHDGFPKDRQEKIHGIIDFSNDSGQPISLHVCWEVQGKNCCKCEKCYRTMANILAEGENPRRFGFPLFSEKATGIQMRNYLYKKAIDKEKISDSWPFIARRVLEKRKKLKLLPYWDSFKWICKAEFSNPYSFGVPLTYRLKNAKGVRGKLAELKIYRMLHTIKNIVLDSKSNKQN